MANIAFSGNMSMLNHLTILPALACLDDACYPLRLRNFLLGGYSNNSNSNNNSSNSSNNQNRHSQQVQATNYIWRWSSPRLWMDGLLFAGILFLSVPVVENLLELDGRHQKMNASFGSFRLVNSYGAFGSVGKQRYEPIISVAYTSKTKTTITATSNEKDSSPQNELEWIEIEFPCKPGSLDRRPCFCAPYHYRLDWNIWFIGFKPHSHYLNQRESWMYHLLAKILGETNQLDGDDRDYNGSSITAHGNWWAKPNQRRLRPWLDLLDYTSREILEQRGSPLYAKVDMYRYEMTAPLWELLPRYASVVWGGKIEGNTGSATVQWWNRHYEEPLLPVVAFDFQRGQLVRADVE